MPVGRHLCYIWVASRHRLQSYFHFTHKHEDTSFIPKNSKYSIWYKGKDGLRSLAWWSHSIVPIRHHSALPSIVILYFCIFVFLYFCIFCIFVFLYFCICFLSLPSWQDPGVAYTGRKAPPHLKAGGDSPLCAKCGDRARNASGISKQSKGIKSPFSKTQFKNGLFLISWKRIEYESMDPKTNLFMLKLVQSNLTSFEKLQKLKGKIVTWMY